MDNVKLFMAHDPAAPYDKAVNALTFKQAKNLRLTKCRDRLGRGGIRSMGDALYLEDIQGLELDGFRGRQAQVDKAAAGAAVVLNRMPGRADPRRPGRARDKRLL